ncbi:beta-1,4-galactosyltransferase 1-like [Dendrobates tinctorius]|uniref:beta-1,4-galactosyltransferase 1-like n=1 Tax=Dendrobates tinctorius TaxID=92724 RepID=UPI003CC943B8
MMKDPLLQGSAAVLPGASLQRACKFLVLYCALHLSITLLYYMFRGETTLIIEHQQFRQKVNSSVGPLVSVLATAEQHASPATTSSSSSTPAVELVGCLDTSPLLVGPLRIEFSVPVDLEQVRKTNPNVMEGGRYKPKDCKALRKWPLLYHFGNASALQSIKVVSDR